jgi:hypothetical protein
MLDRKAVPSRLPHSTDTSRLEYARALLALLEDEFGAALVGFEIADDAVTVEVRIPTASIKTSRGG